MKHTIRLLLVFAVVLAGTTLFGSPRAHAAASPLSLAIVPPVQFPPDDYTVTGLRLSVGFGDHRNIYGIDLGVVGNITRQEFVGVGLSGLFNINHGMTTAIGLQAAGVTNINYQKTTVVGLQLALGANYLEAESEIYGLQLSLANLASHTTINGVQLGIYNEAKAVNGFQIGIVNVATNLTGLQIGLMNFHHQGVFNVSPIINFGF